MLRFKKEDFIEGKKQKVDKAKDYILHKLLWTHLRGHVCSQFTVA